MLNIVYEFCENELMYLLFMWCIKIQHIKSSFGCLKFVHSVIMVGHRRTAVSMGNTFQDLPRLRETADNTEHYILHDIT